MVPRSWIFEGPFLSTGISFVPPIYVDMVSPFLIATSIDLFWVLVLVLVASVDLLLALLGGWKGVGPRLKGCFVLWLVRERGVEMNGLWSWSGTYMTARCLRSARGTTGSSWVDGQAPIIDVRARTCLTHRPGRGPSRTPRDRKHLLRHIGSRPTPQSFNLHPTLPYQSQLRSQPFQPRVPTPFQPPTMPEADRHWRPGQEQALKEINCSSQ